MPTLWLISSNTARSDRVASMLEPSQWTVVHVDPGTTFDQVAGDPDVVAVDGANPAARCWPAPHEAPVVLIASEDGEVVTPDLADDIVFEQASGQEWATRLHRLVARSAHESLHRRYVETLASMAPGVVVIGPSLEWVFANPRAYEIVGHHEDTFGERSFESVVAPADRERIRDTLAKGEYPRGMDVRLVRREGREIDCSASFAPLAGAEGHTVISFEDVTSARETEQELLKTMQFLESLIDASVDAIIATDMSQRIVLFNPSAERITGRHVADAMANATLEAFLGRTSAELVMQRLAVEEHGGEGRLEPTLLELTNVHNAQIPVQLSASMIYEDGEPSGIVLIFTDLRERVRMEERLAEAQKRLAFRDKQSVLAELAGTAAHELNQPLTSMMAYAELLLRQSESGSMGEKAASVLIREAERMAEIVRKIGKITRYETTSYVGQQKIFDLDRAADPSTPESGPEG